jgi:hypothetical protein
MALRLSKADKGWRRRFEDPIPMPSNMRSMIKASRPVACTR